uniref:Kell metallo-endopeptidase (Kell blood group) n=1 Tax=Phasianus colchicus TaxID=9054 RepID=A0A669QDS2_PHACC
NSRNDSVDPCEDFYKYACGSWEGKHSSTEAPNFEIRGSAKEKAIQFYRSCMDTQRIESQGNQLLKDLINQVGGWNITDIGKAKDFNETLQILMGRYNTFPFFRVYVGPSPSDPKTNVIQIDHPEFEIDLLLVMSLPVVICSYVLQVLRVYLSYLEKLGDLLGGPQDGPPHSFSLTLSFISNLQRVVTPLQERRQRGMLFFRTTIRELQEKAPAIDWLSCLQAVFHPMPMNLSQPITVHDMDYLRGMSQIIEEWHKGRVPHIYMIVCLVGNLSPALDSRFQDARQELSKILYGKMESEVVISTFSHFSFSTSSWQVAPWAVHSYYSIRHHMVVFPAGMFRSPFFHVKFPSAVNFGAIGVFMAHELLHAFYDYMRPGGCPTCNSSVLQKSIDCLVEQYESFGFKVNGTSTLLENTADTGGLAIAYQAYKNWMKKHKQEEHLPKIGLSHDQLFYFSFAHAMCGHQDPEDLQSSLDTDPHSPLPLRVYGPVSNNQDFVKHFHCPRRSPMNPDSKCHIW